MNWPIIVDTTEIKRDYTIPFYDNGFDERRPDTYLNKSELAQLEAYSQAQRQDLLTKAIEWRLDGQFLMKTWWLDYYHERPRVPMPVIPANDSDPISIAYWDCLRDALWRTYDNFLYDYKKWTENAVTIAAHNKDLEAWREARRNASWWDRTFRNSSSPPEAPPLHAVYSRVIDRQYLLERYPAKLVEATSDWLAIYSDDQIDFKTEGDWKRLFDRAMERAIQALPVIVPTPKWAADLCEARRPMPMAQVHTREFIRAVREDRTFLTQTVPTYLVAKLGLSVEMKQPLGPFIYATLFLPDIGQNDKPWLYIGKRVDPNDHEYLGSGKVLKAYVEKYGVPFFQRYIVISLPKNASADDLAAAEEGILKTFRGQTRQAPIQSCE